MLKWVREKLEWDQYNDKHICTLATEEGHLDVLKWAVEDGCPLDVDVCIQAAKENWGEDSDMMKWLREQKAKRRRSQCVLLQLLLSCVHGYEKMVY